MQTNDHSMQVPSSIASSLRGSGPQGYTVVEFLAMSPCSGARVSRDKGGVVGGGGHIPSVQGLYLASLGGTESAIGHCAHGPASSGSVTYRTRRPFWSKRIF